MQPHELQTELPLPATEAHAWMTRPGGLYRTLPSWLRLHLPDALATRPADGAPLAVRLGRRPATLALRHDANMCETHEELRLDGELVWQTSRRFEPRPEGALLVETLQPGPLYPRAPHPLRLLAARHQRIALDLERLTAFGGAGATHAIPVVVTGATGLLGGQLCAFLAAAGHPVRRMSRGAAALPGDVAIWNPDAGVLSPQALERQAVVINLAGENIAGGRWNRARKARIMDSRVNSTALLCRTMAAMQRPPALLLNASATGIYGATSGPVTEQAPPGTGFLAEVCRAWEAATTPARDAGVTVRHLRTGLVLAGGGGALGAMLPPFRWGLGGPIGHGRQPMPWIAVEDWLGAVQHLLRDAGEHPALNLTTPEAAGCTNRAFAQSLGDALRRPAFMPLPGFAVRLLFGEMGTQLLLEGQHAQPTALEALGFDWRFPSLPGALAFELPPLE